MKTLVIDNLGGPLTRKPDGPLNSGLAKFDTSWGYDPFTSPGNLTWNEQPTSVLTLSMSSVAYGITNMASRLTSSVPYIYSIDGDGKMRSTDVKTGANSVRGTLPYGNNYSMGPGMVFYGSTEKIFHSSNNRIQKINFDGSSPASVKGSTSVVANVPTPMTTFLGKIYFGNGNNIGEIDTTETVTTGSKLSPSLPTNVVVRDLEVTPDGNYLQITATKYQPGGGFGLPTSTQANITDSYRFLWNGTDSTYTSYESFPSTNLTANQIVALNNYFTGDDITGMALYADSQKLLSLPKVLSPFPGGLFSLGNTLGIATTGYDSLDNQTTLDVYQYGQYDNDTQGGLYRIVRLPAPVLTDMLFTTGAIPVTNQVLLPSNATNTNTPGKIYFNTTETSDASGGTDYQFRLWKWDYTSQGGQTFNGVYETQSENFSKKVTVKEVRIYTNPIVTENSFDIQLIGSGGTVLSDMLFEEGVNCSVGQDMMQYNPATAPTYAIGVRIYNYGYTNMTFMKIELDVDDAGK